MEAEYKVCGITGLWADCCALFVVLQPPAGKSKVQIYKALKSNKESTAATLKASVLLFFLRFFCVFVRLFGFYASPVPGVLRFPALAHLSTNQHSASSDMQLGFWRTAWEHGCDGRKALRSRCPNRNVYADRHIYRNINYAWDAAQNPRSQLVPLKKHKHATPQEGGFYLCKNKLVLMPLWTKELINKKRKGEAWRGLSIRWPTAFFCFQPRHVSFFFQVCQAIDEGYCCFGTIDSWLLFKLTKGGFALFSLVSQTSSKPRLKTLFLFFFPFRGEFFF